MDVSAEPQPQVRKDHGRGERPRFSNIALNQGESLLYVAVIDATGGSLR